MTSSSKEPTDLPELVDPKLLRRRRADAPAIGEGQALDERLNDAGAAAPLEGTPSQSRGLWWQYKHLAPVPITLVAGVVLTTIMTPYFKDPLIANLIKEHFNPHYVGILGFDAFLGFVVPFFETMANSETYGIIPLGYFITTHLGWQMAGAIESSRVDARTNFFVHFYTLVVVVALVIGSYVITPLVWIVAYLSFNKVASTALKFDHDVRPKRVHQARIVAACVVVIVGFIPFLAGMVLSHDKAKFIWNTALFFTTPLLWQLIWSPFGRGPPKMHKHTTVAAAIDREQIKGHRAAMNSLLIIAGGCIAWHMYAIIAVIKDPTIVSSLYNVLMHYEGHLHTILFIWVDEIVLWAGFLMIPLVQEGLQAAALFAAATLVVGPGAAVAFYFFWREAQYLDIVEKPHESLEDRKERYRSQTLPHKVKWTVRQVQEPWKRTLSLGRRQPAS
ncbi:hypothetical protein KFL_001600220 [Klebsormidium nitens]|uniref:Uncharacterized protein n=1 Tax=Klebsormidium nitens TaxID=105231 RepID=A0A1Y1I1B9_KLENI|nr:hypothetical protein KFL_001600220 [Klebsormidium nitens]|eukprot:GAQ83752.1 hypothetical protein KFL_001600220 [Klebsormidium nitens]